MLMDGITKTLMTGWQHGKELSERFLHASKVPATIIQQTIIRLFQVHMD